MLRTGSIRSGGVRSPAVVGLATSTAIGALRRFGSHVPPPRGGGSMLRCRRPHHQHGSLLTPLPMLAAQQMRRQSGSTDPYAILGVKSGATDAEIKSAYKKMALQYHPDRNQSPGAEDKFKEISQAYSLLNDPAKRRQYDQMHGGGGGGSGGGSRAYTYGAGGGSHGGQSPFSSGDYARSQGFGNSGFSNVNFDGSRGGGSRMSRDDADAMFRNMFGNMEELLRKMDQQPRGGPGPSAGGTRQTTERVYTTEDGAKHFETIERMPNGRTERTTRTQFPDGTVKEKRETMVNQQQHEAWENLHQSQPPPNWGGFGGSGPYDQAPGGFKGFGDAMGGGSVGAQPGGFQQQAQQAQQQNNPFGFGNRRRSPFGGAAGNPFGVGGNAGNGGGFSNPFESAFRSMGNGGGNGGGTGGQPGSPFGQYGRAGNPFMGQGMSPFFSPQRMFLKTLLLVIILSAVLSFFIHHPGVALFVIAVVLFLRGGRM